MRIQVSSTLENRDNRELNVLPGSSVPWACRKAASETGKDRQCKAQNETRLGDTQVWQGLLQLLSRNGEKQFQGGIFGFLSSSSVTQIQTVTIGTFTLTLVPPWPPRTALWVIVGCAETGQLEMQSVRCSSQQKSVVFSEMVEEQKTGSQGPKKINFIFLSFLAWPGLSVFLKQQAGQEQWNQLPSPPSKLFIRSWIYGSHD